MSVDMMDSDADINDADGGGGGEPLNDSFQEEGFDDREFSPKTLVELADEEEAKTKDGDENYESRADSNADSYPAEADENHNESETPQPKTHTRPASSHSTSSDYNERNTVADRTNGHQENNSLRNNSDRKSNVRSAAKKHVAWQTDQDADSKDPAAWSDTDNANPSSACVNVGAVGQTDQAERATLNASSQHGNKRIKDPIDNTDADNSERQSSDDGLNSSDRGAVGKEPHLNAQHEERDNFNDSRLAGDSSPVPEEVSNVSAKQKRVRIAGDTPAKEDFSNNINAKETSEDQSVSGGLAPNDSFAPTTGGRGEGEKGGDAVFESKTPALICNGDHEPSSPSSVICEKTDTANTNFNRALLFKRRPASANGVWTRSSRLLDCGKTLSAELHSDRPSTSTGNAAACSPLRAYRRLSLQLDNSDRVPSDPQGSEQRFNRGEVKKADLPSGTDAYSPVTKDGPVQKAGEKRVRKVALVTYIDPKEPQTTGEGKEETKDSNARPEEKKPPMNAEPTKQNAEQNARIRPSTAPARRGKSNTSAAAASSSRPRFSASSSRPASSLSSSSSRMGPQKLSRELRFTKEELRRALPRRNFFGCHIKALKEAGIEVEEDGDRPRRRRLFNFYHPEEEEEEEEEEDKNQPKDKKKPVLPPPPIVNVPTGAEDENKENGDEGKLGSDAFLDTAVEIMTAHDRARRRKISMAVQARAVVECKPLQLYLTYVRDNPGEYRHMLAKHLASGAAATPHPSSFPAENCHTARLVQLGRIFQERQKGDGLRADEVLRAAYSLNPRAADPNRFAKPPRDKTPLIQGLIARKQSTAPNFQRKESTSPALPGGEDGSGGKSGQTSKPGSEVRPRQDSAAAERVVTEPLLEVEKRRLKAEEWARTVTTEQLVTAKLNVLKELGHEERELSQWWLAFKTCYYLRPKIRQ